MIIMKSRPVRGRLARRLAARATSGHGPRALGTSAGRVPLALVAVALVTVRPRACPAWTLAGDGSATRGRQP